MKITIEGTPNETKELLQAIGSSKEQLKNILEIENSKLNLGTSTHYYGKDAPKNPKEGDIWFDTKDKIVVHYY